MKRGKKKNRRIRGKNRSLILLSMPSLIWYILFCYLPVAGIILAFKRYRLIPGEGFFYSLINGSEWVGFENFRFLFLNPEIGKAIRNTLLYNMAFLILGTVIPVMLAVGISYIHSGRIRRFSVYAFLSYDRGVVNSVLGSMGIQGFRFYQSPSLWPFILCAVNVWKSSGYMMMLYYARLMAIDTELFDAAAVDGASNFKVIRYIILPELKNVILVMTLLNLGNILSTDFGLFYQVTRNSGSLLSTTETIDVFIYKALMEKSNYGFSAAASLIQNGIGCIILVTANRLLKKNGGGGAAL